MKKALPSEVLASHWLCHKCNTIGHPQLSLAERYLLLVRGTGCKWPTLSTGASNRTPAEGPHTSAPMLQGRRLCEDSGSGNQTPPAEKIKDHSIFLFSHKHIIFFLETDFRCGGVDRERNLALAG